MVDPRDTPPPPGRSGTPCAFLRLPGRVGAGGGPLPIFSGRDAILCGSRECRCCPISPLPAEDVEPQ
eukprot:11655212-Heterocapsa_arctica.AAC.1